MKENKRGILIVSFGTSQNDTCEKTICAIENAIGKAYPNYLVYRAWTSEKIRRKLEKRNGIHIYSVTEAIKAMKKAGLQEIIVQPTYVLSGAEYERMRDEILTMKTADCKNTEQNEVGSCREQRKEYHSETACSIIVSAPLLSTQMDCERIAAMLIDEWQIKDDEMLILMGHGTEHDSERMYENLNDLLLEKGYADRMIGTVQGNLHITDLTAAVRRMQPKKIILVPFMIAAGVHAVHDMAGEQSDSWKSILEKAGYEVTCVLKGLGEYAAVRQIFLEHLHTAMQTLDKTK